MGCCNERLTCEKNKSIELTSCSEENIIRIKEKSLPLSLINAEDAISIIRKYQFEGFLSSAQLRQCFIELNFEVAGFSDCERQEFKLMAALQTSKLHEFQIVSVCGLLLGEGKCLDKAKALFSIYDTEDSNSLGSETVKRMVEDLLDVSTNRIPLIAADDNEAPAAFTLPSSKVEAYVTSLSANKGWFTRKVLSELLENESSINLEQFLKKMTNSRLLGSMLWSYQIRLELTSTHM